VIELFYDDNKLQKIGTRAQEYVLENFSELSISKKYLEVLEL
jgi:hypothetical protein